MFLPEFGNCYGCWVSSKLDSILAPYMELLDVPFHKEFWVLHLKLLTLPDFYVVRVIRCTMIVVFILEVVALPAATVTVLCQYRQPVRQLGLGFMIGETAGGAEWTVGLVGGMPVAVPGVFEQQDDNI